MSQSQATDWEIVSNLTVFSYKKFRLVNYNRLQVNLSYTLIQSYHSSQVILWNSNKYRCWTCCFCGLTMLFVRFSPKFSVTDIQFCLSKISMTFHLFRFKSNFSLFKEKILFRHFRIFCSCHFCCERELGEFFWKSRRFFI